MPENNYKPEPLTAENASRRSEELRTYLARTPNSYLKDVAVMLLDTALANIKPKA